MILIRDAEKNLDDYNSRCNYTFRHKNKFIRLFPYVKI